MKTFQNLTTAADPFNYIKSYYKQRTGLPHFQGTHRNSGYFDFLKNL